MTCIAGLVSNGDVWMAGDSAGIAGMELTVLRQPKIFRTGEFLCGFTTSFRMGQLLWHNLKLAPQRSRDSIVRYMQTTFIDAIRARLTEGGFARKKDEVESGGCFLVGYRGRLFHVGGGYQVTEARDRFDAVGCGAPYALGALYVTRRNSPRIRLLQAMKAAERMSTGVCGPFNVSRLPLKAGRKG